MAGMMDRLMDSVHPREKQKKATDDSMIRRRMKMRVLMAEARKLYPDRPEMQKVYVMQRMVLENENAQHDLGMLQGIGDRVTNPRPIRM
jgi:hypothetical protein